ncbi:hypothetical protein [Nostoc sp. CALU 546]|uniref:hypothetical protein n=1 Tax=Nostoc sp. CALU 546 TaxID=1867241 RepID=UPI003B67649A
MLLEKSQELVDLSQRKKSLQSFAANLQIIQDRRNKVYDTIAAIQPLAEALQAFRQRGMIDIDLANKTDKILNLILNIEENLSNNNEWIFDINNTEINNLKSDAEKLKNTLEQQLSKYWQRYRDQKMPSTNNEILNLLAKVEAFKQTVLEIQDREKYLKNIRYPKNNAEFAICELKIEQLKHSWKSLKSDDFPEAVSHFLQAVSEEGANLSLLTPEVQDWINQNGISDSFKIRLT